MPQTRRFFGLLTAPWVHWTLAASMIGCAPQEDGPFAGQTGSPVVPPDYDSPVPFRPPQETPPDSGPSAPTLRDFRQPGERVVVRGDYRYVLTNRQLTIHRAQKAAAGEAWQPVGRVLEQTQVQWMRQEGEHLLVVASHFDDAHPAEEEDLVTELYAFRMGESPEAPRLVSQVALAGNFEQAIAVGNDRWLVASSILSRSPCRPSVGYGWFAQAVELELAYVRLTEAGFERLDTQVVAGNGLSELDAGFAVAQSGFEPELTATVVQAKDASLSVWEPVTLSADSPYSALMRVVGDQLLTVLATWEGLSVRLTPRPGSEAPSSSLTLQALPELREPVYLASLSLLVGERLLVPAFDGSSPQGADEAHGFSVVQIRDGALEVAAELPAEWTRLVALDAERALALGEQSGQLLTWNADGTLTSSSPFPLTEDASLGPLIGWDATRGEAVFAAFRDEVVNGELQRGVQVVATDSEPPTAGAFLPLRGTTYDVELYEIPNTEPSRSAAWDGEAWLLATRTQVGDRLPLVSTVEHVSADTVKLVSAAHPSLASANLSGLRARLSQSVEPQGVQLQLAAADEAAEEASGASHLLRFAAAELTSTNTQLFAYSQSYSNGCFPRAPMPDAGGEGEGACLERDRAGVSIIDASEPAVAPIETPLPEPTLADESGWSSFDWYGLTAQEAGTAFLQHRGLRCESEGRCEELGIEYTIDEVGGGTPMCEGGEDECAEPEAPSRRVLGHADEYWLYPLSSDGVFEEALGLGRTEPYEWFEAAPVTATQQPFALVQSTPIDYQGGSEGFDRVRRQLVLLESGLVAAEGSSLAEVRKITLPGAPLLVDGERVLSLEPSAELTSGGSSVAGQLHRLRLTERGAVIEQTLSLPSGLRDSRWASERGFALFAADDLCAERSVRLIGLRKTNDGVELAGELSLPGTRWRIHLAHDEAVVLLREVNSLAQYALVRVSGGTLMEPELLSAMQSVPVRLQDGSLIAEY